MPIPKVKKPASGALKWIAGLMGRMDAVLAQTIPALAEAMAPKRMPKCIPFHKRPGYVKRVRRDRHHGDVLARAATGHQPKFPKVRVHKRAEHFLRDDFGAFTFTGRSATMRDDYIFLAANGTYRRKWTAGNQPGATA